MKRRALAVLLIATAALSGCIIVPARHGHHHHDGYRVHDSGGYRDPGPRR